MKPDDDDLTARVLRKLAPLLDPDPDPAKLFDISPSRGNPSVAVECMSNGCRLLRDAGTQCEGPCQAALMHSSIFGKERP